MSNQILRDLPEQQEGGLTLSATQISRFRQFLYDLFEPEFGYLRARDDADDIVERLRQI